LIPAGTVARPLSPSLDELIGLPVPRAARTTLGGKRGPAPRREQQIPVGAQLPKSRRQFVSRMFGWHDCGEFDEMVPLREDQRPRVQPP
jgi:hypothetical protein